MTPEPISIFISYARDDDAAFAEKLYHDLTRLGFKVWWDKAKMESRGVTFHQEILEAIYHSQRFVLIVGPKAKDSPYVRQEIDAAGVHCTPITPVLRLGEYDLVPSDLCHHHCVDGRASRDYGDMLDELVRLLHAATSPRGLPYKVPKLPSGYVRRREDLQALEDSLLADKRSPVVITSRQQVTALYGMGGIGKTTLACALAGDCDVQWAFPDGIFWLEFGQQPNVALRMGDIGQHFGDDRGEYPDEQRAKMRLSALLADKAALLILDDVWSHTVVQAFHTVAGARCRVLVTTRAVDLAGKVGAAARPVDLLSTEEGMAIIVRELGLSAEADNPHADVQRQIVERLGRHALSVGIAAKWIAQRGAASTPDLLRRLDKQQDGADPFKDLKLDASDKNLNLEKCLEFSYLSLSNDEKQQLLLQCCFRALGAFAVEGSFDRAALGAVWGMADMDKVDDHVQWLVNAGLLNRQAGGQRYSQHNLLRAYAHALATQQGELDGCQARHFDYYFAQHSDYNANQAENEQGVPYRHGPLAADWDNIQRALAWGWDKQPRQAVDWTIALQYFMQMQRTQQERLAMLTQALATAQTSQYQWGEANCLKALGDVHRMKNEYGEAVARYEQALPLYRAIGDRLGEANCLQALGDVHRMKNEYGEAVARYEQALTLGQAIGDFTAQLNSLKGLAFTYRAQENMAQACQYAQQLLALADSHPFFRTHSVVQSWREQFAAWGCV